MEAASSEIADVVNEMARCMTEASRAVLGGPTIRIDPKILQFPDRYVDGRDGSTELWATVIRLLQQLQQQVGMNKPTTHSPTWRLSRQSEAEVVEFPTVKTAERAKRSQYWVGVPLPYLGDVYRSTEGRTALGWRC